MGRKGKKKEQARRLIKHTGFQGWGGGWVVGYPVSYQSLSLMRSLLNILDFKSGGCYPTSYSFQSISPEGRLSLVTEALSCQNRTRGQERAANEQKKPWGLIQHTGRDMGRELVSTLSL